MSLNPDVLKDLRDMCGRMVEDYLAGKPASEDGHKVRIVFDKPNNLFVVTLLVGQHPFMGFKFINQKATVDEMMEWIEENLHPVHLQ